MGARSKRARNDQHRAMQTGWSLERLGVVARAPGAAHARITARRVVRGAGVLRQWSAVSRAGTAASSCGCVRAACARTSSVLPHHAFTDLHARVELRGLLGGVLHKAPAEPARHTSSTSTQNPPHGACYVPYHQVHMHSHRHGASCLCHEPEVVRATNLRFVGGGRSVISF